MRKLQNFQPGLVTKTFFSTYDDVSVINQGKCFIWAYLTFLLFKDVELWYMNSHAFVKYRGRFYDSERLQGVYNWQDLPATENGDDIAKRFTVEQFKHGWRGQPQRFNTSWGKLESEARKVLRHAQAPI